MQHRRKFAAASRRAGSIRTQTGHAMQHSTKRILTTHAGSLPRPRRSARHAGGQGAGPAGRRGRPRRAAARRGEGDRAKADRARHRHRRRRRILQAELRHLRQRTARRLRGRQRSAAARPLGRLARGDLVPGVLRGDPRRLAAEPDDLHRADHLQGPRAIAARHREPQGRAQRLQGRGVHAVDLAVQHRGVAAQRLLQDPGGICRRHRRGDARGIQGDRRCGLPLADRRSAARLLLPGVARRQHRRMPQMGAHAGRDRSTMRCAASRRRKSATTPATASTWGRACTTWRSSTCSTSS